MGIFCIVLWIKETHMCATVVYVPLLVLENLCFCVCVCVQYVAILTPALAGPNSFTNFFLILFRLIIFM